MASGAVKAKNGVVHPFAKKDPKPTRARLVSLLDPLGRKRYGEVERFLAGVTGSTSGLFYYGSQWGWAVRYLLGAKNTLCTLHLLPNTFEATVTLGKDMDELLKNAPLSSELKRKLSRGKTQGAVPGVRMALRNDSDYTSFQALIGIRAQAIRAKKTGKSAKTELVAEKQTAQ